MARDTTHDGVGSSPYEMLCSRRVTPFPSPCSVSETASTDDECRRMVAVRIGRELLKRGEPVLCSPLRGISRVDGDHREPLVGRHLDQAIAELRGRKSSDQPTECPAALPRLGRRPIASRPSSRLSLKSRSSITIARQPCFLAVVMSSEMAARRRPSRLDAESAARAER
jgi:hypothetical protein